jgi:hypothetical protein
MLYISEKSVYKYSGEINSTEIQQWMVRDDKEKLHDNFEAFVIEGERSLFDR